MNYETILVSERTGVGIITLNRPKLLNAMNLKLVKELDKAVSLMETADDIKAIVITGAGEKAFSAGADIHEMRTFTLEETEAATEIRYMAQWRMATCRKPIIGAINGLCYGGGTVLATTLDFLVGCERSNFRFLAVAYGQLNTTWTLANMIGWPVAKEILYTGRVVPSDEAYRIGLLNHLVCSDQLMDKTLELARTIADNHPRAVQSVKGLLIQNLGKSWEDMWRSEYEARKLNFKGLPIEEGFKDFIARKGRD